MAYTKKTTTTKTDDSVTNTTKVNTSKKEIKKFQPGDMILCRCVRPN